MISPTSTSTDAKFGDTNAGGVVLEFANNLPELVMAGGDPFFREKLQIFVVLACFYYMLEMLQCNPLIHLNSATAV
jgi:hypothetical protein